jgi:hypothetical protein
MDKFNTSNVASVGWALEWPAGMTPEAKADVAMRSLAAWMLVDLDDPCAVLIEARLRRHYEKRDGAA